MERLAGLEPACIALEERCLNPLGHRRVVIWYRGRGSNSTAPLCRRGALDQKATPAFLAVGAGFEPAMSWLTASGLTTWLPHKSWSGTSDSNRDSLGPRPSGLIRFPSSRTWWKRRELNPHFLVAGQRSSLWTTPPRICRHQTGCGPAS